ncbi:hypothetical protein CRUP_022358 [Coryphaenoides rupestris]|nr:hypothetical protein CRUP_022358 [Coryphaenoides rupestris]
MERYVSPKILQACREKHIAAEGYVVYSVVCEGVVECSNTMEDYEDTELLPQALAYKTCRQRTYGVLLCLDRATSEHVPAVKEWFVFAGNPLTEPELVHPVPLDMSEDVPSLESLWFGGGPAVSDPRLARFLSVVDCQEFSPLRGTVEDSLLVALCLVTHTVLQVQQLSLEDMDAYLSQAVCVRHRSHQELRCVKLPYLSSRAVQMASLYVRGLGHLLGANSACGDPLPSEALMPWQSFDGRLFHSKYLLAHSGAAQSELLDEHTSSMDLFLRLREKVLEACRKRGRTVQSRPRPRSSPEHHSWRNTPPGYPSARRDGWMETEEWAGDSPHGGGWRHEGKTGRSDPSGDHQRGGLAGSRGQRSSPTQQTHPCSYPHPGGGGFNHHHSSPPRMPYRGRPRHPNRRGYRLAPRLCSVERGEAVNLLLIDPPLFSRLLEQPGSPPACDQRRRTGWGKLRLSECSSEKDQCHFKHIEEEEEEEWSGVEWRRASGGVTHRWVLLGLARRSSVGIVSGGV